MKLDEVATKDEKGKACKIYSYSAPDHYQEVKLRLYTDGTFYYTLNTFNQNLFSEGKWIKKNTILLLNSTIQDGKVPIEINYDINENQVKDKFPVGVVKNSKGEEMPDGLVCINNDLIKCAPSYALCDFSFDQIDRIKVVFENGLTSAWIKIQNTGFKMITPIVKTQFLLRDYFQLINEKYIFTHKYIKNLR